MAFLRVEKKKTGTYLRIMQSFKEDGVSKHRTLYSLGKSEDYTPAQLESIAKKLLALAGKSMEEIVTVAFSEQGRYNYGYALILGSLWSVFKMNKLVQKIQNKTRTKFNWETCLKLMIAERINEPSSKRQNHFNQCEYIGFDTLIELHQFYRTLDLVQEQEDTIKEHLYKQQSSMFSGVLDVVFYDVTTLYFDSQIETEESIRQKGYSKDGKAQKTQIVLGILVDKLRNPVTYNVYPGNTYEGETMIDALKELQKKYKIDQVVVVADSGMIDKENRQFMVDKEIDYIIGDRIKNLGKEITEQLLNRELHQQLGEQENAITFIEVNYKERRLICTYSAKRAAKDAFERQKLIDKANAWLSTPSKYKQAKKKGAGRFITSDEDGMPIGLNLEQIKADEKFDGFKAISTTTDLAVEEILSKYKDLFEVEHAFRTLKSQLEIRPMFHWTDERIKGHICMCFIAYAFLNYTRNKADMQYSEIIRALDKMQVSKVLDHKSKKTIFMRSGICENQERLLNKMKLPRLADLIPENAINQYFT
jgi:transposase